MNQTKHWYGMIYVLPSFIILALISIAPIIYTAYLSLTNFDGFEATFIGAENYTRMLTDSTLHSALWHTLVFTLIAVPLQMAIPLVLAEFLSKVQPRWLSGFVRSVLFVPVIASLILVGTVWQFMLAADVGFFNQVFAAIGLPNINFLGNPTLALICVSLVTSWKNIGYFLVIYYAAVMDIPPSLHEAAMIDGAGPVRRFFSITVPSVKNVNFLVMVLSTIWSFQVFDLVYAMTGGGPGGATTTIVMAIYGAAFQQYQFGYASAIAILLLVVIVSLSAVQKLVFSRKGQ